MFSHVFREHIVQDDIYCESLEGRFLSKSSSLPVNGTVYKMENGAILYDPERASFRASILSIILFT
jgi:hypothetical protein